MFIYTLSVLVTTAGVTNGIESRFKIDGNFFEDFGVIGSTVVGDCRLSRSLSSYSESDSLIAFRPLSMLNLFIPLR